MTLLKHQFNPVATCGAILVAVIVGLWSIGAQGQSDGASGAIEVAELRAALETVQKQVDRERDKATAAETKVRALTESLAEANRVREEQTKAHDELQLKVQAFGVDLLKSDPNSVDQRLLKAVRELDLAHVTNEVLSREITSLSEALVHFMQLAQGADAQSIQLGEVALKSANEAIGMAAGPKIEVAKKLKDAKVVSIDPEVGLIVLNVGRNSGARIGMPIEVLRTDRPIGTAMVVDVRDGICGAVLQEMLVSGNDVKVGDSIRPRPQDAGKTL